MKSKPISKQKLVKKTSKPRKQSVAKKQRPVKTEKTISALQISETRYRRLFETAQDGILILNAKTAQIDDVNPYLINMLGYSHKELLGKKLWEVSPFIDTALNKTAFKKLQATGYIRYEDLPLETKDGKKIAVEFVSNIYNVDGKKVIQCNIREITARKKVQDGLLASEYLLRELFENMSSCVAIYTARANGKDFIITAFNKAAEKVEKVEREKIIGKSVLGVFPGVKDFGIFKVFQQVWKTGKPQNFPVALYKDKRISGWRENYIYKLPSGEIVAIYDDITERMRIEQKLQDNELRYRTLADSGQALIWTSGLDKKCNYFNQTWLKFTGRKIEQELGDGWTKGVHPDDLKRCIAIYTGAFDRRERFSMDYRLRHHDGQFRWIQDDGTPRYDGQGNFLGYIGHCLDITERKKAQEALLSSEFQHRSTLNSMADPIHAIDRNFRFVLFNDAFKRWNNQLGLKTDVIGKNLFEVFPFLPHKVIDEYKKVFNTGQSLTTEEHNKINNREFITETRKIPIPEQGETLRIITVIRDITERKQAERELQNEKNFNQTIIQNSPAYFVAIGADGKTIMMNKALLLVLGYNADEVVGVNYQKTFVPKSERKKIAEVFDRLTRLKVATLNENYILTKDGRELLVEWHGQPVFKANNKFDYFFGVGIDVTARKQAEEKLRESEENFHRSLDESPLGVRIVTAQGKTLYANKTILNTYGYNSIEQLDSTPLKERYTPQSYAEYQMRVKKRTQGKNPPTEYDVSIVRINGEIRHLRAFRKEIIWNGEKHFQVIYHDMTKQKLTEEALRESEALYRSQFEDHSAVKLVIEQGTGNIIDANEAAANFYGWPREKLKQMKIQDINTLSPDGIKKEMEKARANKRIHFEFRHRRADGSIRDVEVFSSKIRSKGKDILHSIVHDITDRKRAESQREEALAAFKESEEKYRTILETMQEGYYEVDLAGNTTFANNAMCLINGYSKEELIGSNNRQYTTPETARKVYQAFNEVYKTGIPGKVSEHEIIKKDGTKIWIEASMALRKDASGKIIGFKGIVRDVTERRQAEKVLRENEFLLRKAQEVARLGSYNLDTVKGTWISSPLLDDIFGIDEGYPKNTSGWVNLIHPEDKEVMFNYLNDYVLTQHNPFEKEYRIIRQNDGRLRWVFGLGELTFDKNGRVTNMIGTIQDITERKSAEEELHKQHESLETMIEASPIMIYFKDTQNRFTRVNKALLDVTGLAKEEIEGKANEEINPRQASQLLQEDREIISTGKPKIGTLEIIKTKKGTKALLTDKVPYRDKYGKIIGIIGFSVDITEQKKAQDELLKSEERYRSLVESAQEGVYQSTRDGKYITINPAFACMLGYASPQEVMQAITDISHQLYVHPQDREKLLKLVDKYGSATDFETQFYRKDGSRVWLSVSMHSICDHRGKILYYQGMTRDITEKKQMETERQENVKRLRKALGATINAMAVTVETRDPYTAGHQRRVADLARAIATEMKLTSDQIDGVRMAGMIHDIGKISIPSEILTKPTQLSALEYNLIKTHPDSGHAILKDIEFPWPIARIVLEHHERVNGSGYPCGLKENEILMESKILAVADVVEAISSHRPYRAAHGIEAGLKEIEKYRGVLYDADVVDACLRLFREKNYTLAA